jgi:hypothetical protein
LIATTLILEFDVIDDGMGLLIAIELHAGSFTGPLGRGEGATGGIEEEDSRQEDAASRLDEIGSWIAVTLMMLSSHRLSVWYGLNRIRVVISPSKHASI